MGIEHTQQISKAWDYEILFWAQGLERSEATLGHFGSQCNVTYD